MNHTNTDSSRFVVRVTGRKDPLTIRKWNPDFWFLAEGYRSHSSKGVPITIYNTRQEAQDAIDKERRLLDSEWNQYIKDLMLLKLYGLTKRYIGIEGFLSRQYNSLIFQRRHLKYEVVEVSPEQLESLLGNDGEYGEL